GHFIASGVVYHATASAFVSLLIALDVDVTYLPVFALAVSFLTVGCVSMGYFDGLPMPPDKPHLKKELSKIDETWAAARFDSLPHVVEILTGKDHETELYALREQSESIEDVVDEVVQTYHNGFNRAIQNYSQILRLFSESAENVTALKTHLPEAKKRLAARNKQLHQFWYRSVTLRHIISLLDQIEKISKIPARIEKFIAEKQFYAAIQLHMQSAMMLEREGFQSVGALQDVRTELSKLRTLLFQKVMEDLHGHLYNKGEYSSNDWGGEEGALDHNGTLVNWSTQANGCKSSPKDNSNRSQQIPPWLSAADPDEFLDAVTKSDAALHMKYLQTMIECLCKLGKDLRPTLHEILTSMIKKQAEVRKSLGSSFSQANSSLAVQYLKGQLEIHQMPKQMHQNGGSMSGTLLSVSPVTPGLAPMGPMQVAAKELFNSIFYTLSNILENLVIVGELIESKDSQKIDMNINKPSKKNIKRKAEPDGSQVTGRFNVAFSVTVLQSECQQLIFEILCATPDAASADAAVQTARLANGLTFAFRFADATVSIVNQGWSKKSSSKLQEGYGSAAVLPEQGIYLAAAVYHPVIKFTDKLASLLPQKFQLGNDGLLSFIENFVKDRFLPAMFVDYRKSVQQAISSPAAFRPRAHASASYSQYVEKGRPVLQGLLAIDLLAKELLGWAQEMPRFAAEIVKFVQALFERAYERCRTSFMEAVLEKQCYMLVGRHDVESLMQLDPASSCLTNFTADSSVENNASDAYSTEVETEMSDLLWSLCPIKQDNLIHDDNKLILLASLSDSLEYVADSIESIAPIFSAICNQVNDKFNKRRTPDMKEAIEKDLGLFADDYRKLAVDCLKILRIEMQLETVYHMQEMTSREYMDDHDAEEPDDFITSLITQLTQRDEEIAPFVSSIKGNYVFGGIGSVAAYASIKALAQMKSINLFGVQQICRNSIALEQALAAIPSINGKAVLLSLDRVRTYYELLNMPFEGLLAFITEHENLFSDNEYCNLLSVQIPGREIPADAQNRISDMLFR
ncbi:hypothetical protein V2J09_016232, partial [Rumex salicifolius]